MPRDLVLGNGNLLVAMDRHLFIRDLYWPYVGLYNHLSGRAVRFGVWVDGVFSWIDDTWDRDLRYRPYSLVTDCHLRSDALGLALSVSDVVDHRTDSFVRRVVVRNLHDREREVRIFWAADTTIGESDIGDTCYYEPYGDAVVHYKWRNYLLFGGTSDGGKSGLSGYACGMKGLLGMEGTWRDCEDGVLTGNPIAQGSVDSAISLSTIAPPQGETSLPIDLYLLAGPTRERVLEMRDGVRRETVDRLFDVTERYWRGWVGSGSVSGDAPGGDRDLDPLPARVQALFRRSLLIIRTQTDNRGAILAANDTDIMQTNRAHYSYMWPRDGALVTHALDRAGFGALTRQFFVFCRDILPRASGGQGAFPAARGEHAAVHGAYAAVLAHKYAPDGSVGSSWHSSLAPDGSPEQPLQEDETALVVWALFHHYETHGDFEFVEAMYRSLARPCADFLLSYRDPVTGLPLPSWDIWEERRGIHTYTVCTVIAALRAAARLALLFGDVERSDRYAEGALAMLAGMRTHLYNPAHRRFARRLECRADGTLVPDMVQDAALHALHLFDVLPLDDPQLVETMRQVGDRLWVKAGIGGMARYEGDYYARVSNDLTNVPGNPWIICTLWQAQWQIASAKTVADLDAPRDLLEWANLTALPSGVLPEQIHPYNFTPMTVAPLTWSHAEVIETVYKWLRKHRQLSLPEGSESASL
jgi:GH15 family glucan-1,4-alpha-glucosidase